MPSVSDPGSTKGERERLHTRVKEFDLEQPIDDWLRLPYQLVQALFDDSSVTLAADVAAAGRPGKLTVNRDAEANRALPPRWPHHHVQVARMKAISDFSASAVQGRRLPADLPLAGKLPSIDRHSLGSVVGTASVPLDAA